MVRTSTFTSTCFIIALSLCHTHALPVHPQNRLLSSEKYVGGVWDNEVTVIYNDGISSCKFDEKRGVNLVCEPWKKRIPLPPTEETNPIIGGLQMSDTRFLLVIYDLFTRTYDLSAHKFIDKSYFAHDRVYGEMIEDAVCFTENAKDGILHAVTPKGLLSFDILSKIWSVQMYSHMIIDQVPAGCSMDVDFEFIYIFRSELPLIKYALMKNEWNIVPNVFIAQQANNIKCELMQSQNCIYCMTDDVLFRFNPSDKTITNVMTTQKMHYLSMAVQQDYILMIGKNETNETIQCVAYRTECSIEKTSAQRPHKSTPNTRDEVTNHRRRLGSEPMITLNATYTENLTLQAGNTYVVNSNVDFSSVTRPSFIVPDNVTIVFNGSYILTLRGHVLMGTCVDDGSVGVSSNPIRVYSAYPSAEIRIYGSDPDGSYNVSICNTNFSGIYEMRIYERSNMLFSNLAFYNVTTAIYLQSTYDSETVRNSYFYQCSYGITIEKTYGAMVIRNNIFENTNTVIRRTGQYETYGHIIINNTFLCNGAMCTEAICIYALQRDDNTVINNTFIGFYAVFYHVGIGTVSHNIFRDNDYVFYNFNGGSNIGVVRYNDFIGTTSYVVLNSASYGGLEMMYNNFINNNVAIQFGWRVFGNVSYNNFVNNTIIYDLYASSTNVQPHCGYNYYGIATTNAWDIRPHINDVCNGNVQYFYVKFWPWYNEQIDFSVLPVELTLYGNSSHLSECVGPNLHPEELNGTKLSPIWIEDLVLTADKSPYYIIWHTRVNYNLIIEPSVELIFAGNYYLKVNQLGGGVSIGESMCNETLQYNGVGLYDNDTAIFIHGMAPGYGTFQWFHLGSWDTSDLQHNARICNTKFAAMEYCIWSHYFWLKTQIDNCEFESCSIGVTVKRSEGELITITDSLFHGDSSRRDIWSAISTEGVIHIENNRFANCGLRAIDCGGAQRTTSIVNNIFDNEHTSAEATGIAIYAYSSLMDVNMTNNTFKNFEIAFQNNKGSTETTSKSLYTGNIFMNNDIALDFMDYTGTHVVHNNELINNGIAIQSQHATTGYLDIKYNNFVHNNVSIVFLNGSPKLVQSNNFIENKVNFEMKSAVNADNCSMNWNGEVSDITNPVLVQSKIFDICTPNGYDGKVKFWPYFDGPLFFDDIGNLPALYTITYINCSSIHEAASYLISDQPTRSPTETDHPTDNPTTQPSAAPTAPPTNAPSTAPTYPTFGPTFNPSTEPTTQPTQVPTTDPTTEPTVEPTQDPTYDPTADPTADPSIDPTHDPTFDPTRDPTQEPTFNPTGDPTSDPSIDPTQDPTVDPTIEPTTDPTVEPTTDPTSDPTIDPTRDPTTDPTVEPTADPTFDPTADPTYDPTVDPTTDPTIDPTSDPTTDPTRDPTAIPTTFPTTEPTVDPTVDPTFNPTADPTDFPTIEVTVDEDECHDWEIQISFTLLEFNKNGNWMKELRTLCLKAFEFALLSISDDELNEEWCIGIGHISFRNGLADASTDTQVAVTYSMNDDLYDDIFKDFDADDFREALAEYLEENAPKQLDTVGVGGQIDVAQPVETNEKKDDTLIVIAVILVIVLVIAIAFGMTYCKKSEKSPQEIGAKKLEEAIQTRGGGDDEEEMKESIASPETSDRKQVEMTQAKETDIGSQSGAASMNTMIKIQSASVDNVDEGGAVDETAGGRATDESAAK